MRYTLRLLTIQQFQRAAAPDLRVRDDPPWPSRESGGRFRFVLVFGLGARVTPNRTDDADDWLKQQRGGRRAPTRAAGSPHQLVSCPWCGSGLEPGRDISVNMVTRRTLITCPDPFCPFGPGAGQRMAFRWWWSTKRSTGCCPA